MATYKCTKCGETASSKCKNSRTVFPANQMATAIDNRMTVEFEIDPRYPNADETEIRDMVIKYTVFPNGELVVVDQFMEFIRNMAALDDDTITKVFCDHDWEITEGECMFGCCKA